MQTARTVAMKGALSPFLIPKHGFYAPRDGKGPTVLPNDVSFTYRLRTLWKEMALRARLAPKGFVRGLQGTGIVGIGRLYASVIRADGRLEHLGLVCTKVITDAGVAFLVDDWDVNTASATNDITTLKYHGCGTGTTAEAAADTALVTESTTALNPDSTLKRRPTDVAALLTVSGAVVSASLGTFSVTLTAAALTLAAGTYYYDVQRTDAASVAVLSIGAFVISQEVRVP